MADNTQGKVPLLLLKTKSAPTDVYEEYFSKFDQGQYDPVFVPVLEHRFKSDALDRVRRDITNGGFVSKSAQFPPKYGAMIFTSQRAVEAFAEVVQDIRNQCGAHSLDEYLPEDVPLYVVGPATARGLKALGLKCPILGEETGNGDILSDFVLEHYNGLYKGCINPAVLFMVGDKRRDIIPKKLQSEQLAPQRRAKVDELEVYETGEMLSFKENFSRLWQKNEGQRQWVVVFSPTGCQAMLESLRLLNSETGKIEPEIPPRNILVATIGPTTRDYLVNEFGFAPDVCAEKPSPEGIAAGLRSFIEGISK